MVNTLSFPTQLQYPMSCDASDACETADNETVSVRFGQDMDFSSQITLTVTTGILPVISTVFDLPFLSVSHGLLFEQCWNIPILFENDHFIDVCYDDMEIMSTPAMESTLDITTTLDMSSTFDMSSTLDMESTFDLSSTFDMESTFDISSTFPDLKSTNR